MTRRRGLLTVLCALLLVTLAACSSDTKVGEGIDVDKLKGQGGTRLGERTTTTQAVTTTTSPSARTTVTRATATTAAAAVSLEIKIKQAAPQFDPAVGQVRSGSTVRWTNTDSVARSVESDSGAFVSPSIPPGGHFDLKAPAPGTYNYHDGTRPYAVGQLQVV